MENIGTHFQQNLQKRNIDEYIYLRGDEEQEGSMRIQVLNGTIFHFEVMVIGAWVDAPLQSALNSMHCGYDMDLGAAGGWLQTSSTSEGEAARRLIPHVHYNDGGTFGFHVPTLAPKTFNEDWQWRFDEESAPFTDATNTFPMDENLFVDKVHFKCGSSVPSATDITEFSIYSGSTADPNNIYYTRRYIGDVWEANTEITLDLHGTVQMIYDSHRANNDITLRIRSYFDNRAIEPGSPLSLLGYSVNGLWWFGIDAQRFEAKEIVQERFTLDNTADILMTLAGEVIYDHKTGDRDVAA